MKGVTDMHSGLLQTGQMETIKMDGIPENATLIPIDQIEILNSRERNKRVFEEIVENIRTIGLKKPITVTMRQTEEGAQKYLLVCGEGRLIAFRSLGQTHIPAIIINVSDDDALIMSLAENIARHGYRPLEILADIGMLISRGYNAETIVQKTGLSPKYVRDIVFLLDQGDSRLLDGVKSGKIPLTTALEIAHAKHDDQNLGDVLQQAYESGQLNGQQVTKAKRLAQKAEGRDPASTPTARGATTSYNLVRTYQMEVDRQHKMVLKAEHAHQRLLLVVQGLKTLFGSEHFGNLLRAEGMDVMPKCLADRLNPSVGESA
jgi:ParB family chromosome partitioning protein